MEGRIRVSIFANEYKTRFLTAVSRMRRGKVSATLKDELGRSSICKTLKASSELSVAMTGRGFSGSEWRRNILAKHTKISPNFVHFIRTCDWRMKYNSTKRSRHWRRKQLGDRRSRRWSVSCIKWMRRVVVDAARVEQNEEQESVEKLKSLIPGGRGMDTLLLLEETIDYIQTLQLQLQSLNATGFLSSP